MLGILLTEQHRHSEAGGGGGGGGADEGIDPRFHQAVELLLEDYNRQLQTILSEIHYLQKRVQSTQELVAMSLDAYRNRMIRMNLNLSVAAVCLATCTTAAGFCK